MQKKRVTSPEKLEIYNVIDLFDFVENFRCNAFPDTREPPRGITGEGTGWDRA